MKRKDYKQPEVTMVKLENVLQVPFISGEPEPTSVNAEFSDEGIDFEKEKQ